MTDSPPRKHFGQHHHNCAQQQGGYDYAQIAGLTANQLAGGKANDHDRQCAKSDHRHNSRLGRLQRPACHERRIRPLQEPADVLSHCHANCQERAALNDRREGTTGVRPTQKSRHDPHMCGA